MTLTAADVRAFVIADLADAFRDRGVEPAAVGDDYDLVTNGIIDSFGLLELIAAVNDGFGLDIDFEDIDPEDLTIIGRFSEYVAASTRSAAA